MLAVAGGKGGSGKTTTALGVAAALAQRRRRPLVVDCDLDAPNLHLRANVPRIPGVDSAPAPESAASPAAELPGVDVLPAGRATGDDLDAVLARLPDDRPVVLDCPAGASESATRPLRAANSTLVVATRGRESIEDAVKTASMARAVGTGVAAVALTRARTTPEGLETAFGVSTVVPVPNVASPLDDDRAAAAYGELAAGVTAAFRENR